MRSLEALAENVRQCDRPPPTSQGRPAPEEIGPGPFLPEAVFDVIAATAPSDAIYVNESTSTIDFMWHRLPMQERDSYYFGVAGGLGFAMPAALGVQLAEASRRVIASSVMGRPITASLRSGLPRITGSRRFF